MANFLAPIINDQQEDANGKPLSGGLIEVYLAGTSTPATTTSDKAGATPNSWPIVLNTLGVNSQGAVWLTGGSAYKYLIKNSAGVLQRTIDNVSGINDTTIAADQWVVFPGTPTFVSDTSFTVPGDQTQAFVFGARVKTVNTGGIVYGTVVRSVFSSLTTVSIIPDSGVLDAGLSVVSTALLTPTNPAVPTTLTLAPFRNRIINGAFRFDQRNSGAAQVITAGAAAYTLDRFYVGCTGANITSTRIAGSGGYAFAQVLSGAASVTATMWGHRIESSNCRDWAGKLVNVQVPISAAGITTATWSAYTADATDVWAAKTLIATGSIPVSGTLETKYFSFVAPSGVSRGVAIEITTGALGAGQSITFQGACQAESDRVTPFEVVEVGEDFRRCQRYYEVGDGVLDAYQLAANSAAVRVSFKTTKRAVPTLGYAGSSTVNVTTADARTPTVNSLVWYAVVVATGSFVWEGNWTASAEL
jgi:hypothetical protein